MTRTGHRLMDRKAMSRRYRERDRAPTFNARRLAVRSPYFRAGRMAGYSLLKRIPINLMHSRTLSALMVRSRNLGSTQIPQPRARRLEHRKSGLPDLRTLMPISGKPEIGGRPILRDGAALCLLCRKRMG